MITAETVDKDGRLINAPASYQYQTTEAFSKKVIDSKSTKTANFKLKRFFDGMKMHDWYYYDIIG